MTYYDGDVLVVNTTDGGDISATAGTVSMTSGFETAVYLSLFGGNAVDPQWWGDELLVSGTERVLHDLPMTSANLVRLSQAVQGDLKWMLDDKVANTVDVRITGQGPGTVTISVTILAEGSEVEFNYTENWKAYDES